MFSVRGRGVARLAATILVSGLVATGTIATAGSALADEGASGTGGVTAKLGGLTDDKGAVEITEKNGSKWSVDGGLFTMEVEGGGSLFTYCIDLRTGAKRDFNYKEVGWDESSLHNNANAGKILWILEHAYPKLSAETLGGNVGVDLSKQEAAAGTQAAIWTLSDDVVATPKDEDAEKLKKYLLEKAVELDEPTASLSLSPATVAGKAGEKLGPITVTTNAETAKLATAAGAPAGVQVVGKDGKPVTDVKSGDQVYFDVPAGTADGTAELTAEATTKVSLGRAFVSIDGPSQTLILAGSSDSTVTAKASATWAKKGAVPSVTVAKDCAKGGLEIIAGNKGDEAWTFDLKGASYTVGAGETKTITVPLAEDEAYKFTITGPNGFEETFEGVLDCKTATPGPKPSETPSTTPSATPSTPSTTGGTTGDTTGTTGTTTTGGGDLAETGSSSATPMIAGIAAALVVIGGGAVFFLRKKKTAGQ
ncbi:LAETG motif-containing sortase-dependent surface protein [Streptomyces sp. NK15101]|uniref:LAETG motif-containing sortase-dependent surface protein n=1 Tax=Streptomyces sp. NK15101 TaxID=2873261 RepID=UPI001CEC0A55|nr:LAETG motif-containing sortase-dependent surface protein [Streptomyces sp. NK15101]